MSLVAGCLDCFLGPGLTHSRFLVMTGYIVPLDTVSIEIVENTETGLEYRYEIRMQSGSQVDLKANNFRNY